MPPLRDPWQETRKAQSSEARRRCETREILSEL